MESALPAADGDDLQHLYAHEPEAEVVNDDDSVDAGEGFSDAEVLEHSPEESRAEVERLAERVRRHHGDRDLFAAVQAAGFQGDQWDQLLDDLVKYGMAVSAAWAMTGYVFRKLNEIGRPLRHTAAESLELARDAELRNELCGETVAIALNNFVAAVRADRGWTVEGGASLTTYFVGTCTRAFSNPFRTWSRQERRWSHLPSTDPQSLVDHGEHLAEVARGPHVFADPERAAADGDQLRRVLAELTRPEQVIVTLTDEGFSQQEIAEVLGVTVRAVEARLYRLRQKDIRGRVEGHGDD